MRKETGVDGGIPDFQALREMFHEEAAGLTDAQLDWEDSSEEWSRWSIRRQISHVALAYFFWWAKMWGKTLWPENPPGDPVDFSMAAPDKYDRRLDEEKYWKLEDLLPKLDEALRFAERAAEGRGGEELRTLAITRSFAPELMMGDTDEPVHRFWARASAFHDEGLSRDAEDETKFTFTLGAMLRQMYWEALAHLRTIQRLKLAQGLAPAVKVPREGLLLDPFFWGPEDEPGT